MACVDRCKKCAAERVPSRLIAGYCHDCAPNVIRSLEANCKAMGEFEHEIGDTVALKASVTATGIARGVVVKRLTEECCGGTQHHYTLRPIVTSPGVHRVLEASTQFSEVEVISDQAALLLRDEIKEAETRRMQVHFLAREKLQKAQDEQGQADAQAET